MKAKSLIFTVSLVFIFASSFGQLSKTVNVGSPGTLSGLLTNYELNNVTDLTLTGTIDSLDYVTMKSMYNLKNINLSGVTTANNRIPELVFLFMMSLKSIILPSSLTIVGQGAFLFCSGLTSVTFPSTLITIEASAFSGCSGLSEISFPSSLESIGGGAFQGCDGISAFAIPASVILISEGAFSSLKLNSITVDAANPNYCDVNGVLFDKNITILFKYPQAKTDKNYSIPSTVTTISTAAFTASNKLRSVTIPSAVTHIGDRVFESCDSLISIIVDDANLNYSDIEGILFNKDQSLLIKYPLNRSTSYVVPESVTTIEQYAFYNNRKLKSVVLPPTLSKIRTYGFANCIALKSLIMPSSLDSLGVSAFYSCTSLDTLKIPSPIDSIPVDAFVGCTALTSVTIPSTVTFMSYTNLNRCENLASIKINSQIPVAVEQNYYPLHQIDTVNCLLYVPAGSLDAYRNAPIWSSFDHIVEFEFSLEVSRSTLELAVAEGSTADFSIKSNTEWTVACDQDWLHISAKKGMDNRTIVLTADANPIASNREANITAEGIGVEPLTISVVQAGLQTGIDRNNIPDMSITLNPTHELLNVKGAAGNALAIYNMQGNLVISGKVASDSEMIDVHQLPSGIYLVKTGNYSIKISK